MGDDELFAVPFCKDGQVHRRVLFGIDPRDAQIVWLDPSSKLNVTIGQYHLHAGLLVASFMVDNLEPS